MLPLISIPQQQCTGQIACLNAFFPGYFVKTKVKYALLCILVLQDLPFNIRIITSYLKMSGMPRVIAKILSSDPEFSFLKTHMYCLILKKHLYCELIYFRWVLHYNTKFHDFRYTLKVSNFMIFVILEKSQIS
jgi:hypothetical protein